MREERKVRNIMKVGGYVIGVTNPTRSRIFCNEDKASFNLSTKSNGYPGRVEDSPNIPIEIKSQLLELGYQTMSRLPQWNGVDRDFIYSEVIYLNNSTTVITQGKKHKII